MVKAKIKEERSREKTFSIKKENGKILKAIVETLAGVADETEITITPEAFVVKAMDPSRICLLKLSIKKADFETYECSSACEIGINLSDLNKILNRSSASDSIELTFKEEEQKLKVKMQREGSNKTRTFSLNLLDVDIEEVPMDNLLKIDYEAKWAMPLLILIEAMKDAEIYSEIFNARAIEGQGLIFTSAGQIGEMEYDLPLDGLTESDLKGTNTGAYSLKFLKAIVKIVPVTEKLEMLLKTDHPLRMTFNLLEGGELVYFLAPRVDEQESDEETDIEPDDLEPAEPPTSEPEEESKEEDLEEEGLDE
jgi:proliferating cell nuclear antigen